MRKLLFFVFALCFSAGMMAQETVPFTNVPSQGTSGVVTYNVTLTGGYTLGSIDWDGFASTIESGTYGSELTLAISGPLGSTSFALGSGTTYAPGAAFNGSTGFFSMAGDPAGTWTFDFYESYNDGGAGPDANWDNIDFDFNVFSTAPDVTAPWAEPFAAGLPAYWSMSGPENWLFNTGAGYGASSAGDHTSGGGTNYAWVDGSGTGTNTGITLTTPLIDPTGLTIPELTFWYFSNNTDDPGDNNTLYVEMAYDGGAFANIFTYSGDNPNWQKFALDLSGYGITTSVQFRFIVDESAVTAYWNDMLIDDVSVDEMPTTPIITVTPASPFDFNFVQINHTASQTFTVTNTGGGVGSITAASIAGDAEFTIASTTGIPGSLPPDLIEVEVQFAPLALGTYTATLTITDAGGTTDVLLSGEGVAVIANDDCADAITVGPTYPETVTGTTKGAEIDCAGVLDWGAVWYEVTLPYALNDLSASYCGTATPPFYTGGIVYIPDCSSCASYVIADAYAFDPCPSLQDATLQMTWYDVPGPGTILFPAYAADINDIGVDFTLTFDVTDANVVLPGTNCAVPIVVSSLPYNTTDNTNLYGDDYSSIDNPCTTSAYYLDGDDVVYSYTPAADECIDITLTNTGSYVGLYVFEGCNPFTTCVANDLQSGGNPSLTGIDLIGGTTYYIVISTWPAPQSTAYDLEIDVCAGPPPGDECATALPINCGDIVSGTTVGASNSAIPDCQTYPNTAPDLWYKFTGTGQMVSADLCGSGYDTRISVFEGSCAALVCVDGNDDYCGLQSRIDWYAESGVDYFIMVHGYNTSSGVFDLTLDCTDPATATWIGGDGSYLDPNPQEDWFGADNWDVQDVPGAGTDVTVPAGLTYYPTIDRNATANNLSMGSDASGSATLLDNGFLTMSGTASVDLYFSGNDPDWHLVSSPVAAATAGVFLDMYLQSFNNANYVYTDIEDENTVLSVMEGYGLYSTLGAANTVTFTGNLNLGTEGKAIGPGFDSYNWNLLGNPFVSALDWEAVTIPGAMTNEVHYIEAATGNDLSYVQGVGGTGSQYVPPMQGFFVSATGAGNLTVDDAARSHGSGAFYKNSNPLLVVLEAAGENFADETWIHFNEVAGEEHDGQFDAYKRISLSNPELPQIFSYTPGGVMMSVNGMPEVESVPVGFTAVESGVFTINAKETGEFSELYLEDLLTNTVTSLMDNDYTFTYTSGDAQNRFILHFSPLAIGDQEVSDINIFSFDKDLYVEVPEFTT
ncbi:MAG: hypothetical protein R2750_10630 [Bacteroidales bacterium]